MTGQHRGVMYSFISRKTTSQLRSLIPLLHPRYCHTCANQIIFK